MGGEDKPPVQPSPVVALLGLLTPILLHVLGLVLIVLDLALWFVTGGVLRTLYGHATKRTVFAAPAGEADVNGPGQTPSKVWRSVEAIAAGELINDPPNLGGECHTAYEALARAYKVHAGRPAQLIRPLLSWRTEAGYRFPAKVFGPTITKTFAQLGEEAHAFGAGLRALGLKPQPASLASKDHAGLLIYEDTCAEWFVAAHGAFSQDIVVATSYATLGASAVEKAVKQGGAKAVMCNRKALPQVLELVTKMPSLVAIIYTDNLCTPEEIAAPPATPKRRSKKLSVLSHTEVIELGRANPVAPTPLEGPALEHFAANVSHTALYGFMLAMPATGIAMGYYGGKGVPFYGLYTFPGKGSPGMPAKEKEDGKFAGTMFKWHTWMGQYIFYLLPVHVGAVGLHTFKGQPILSRVNPFASPK